MAGGGNVTCMRGCGTEPAAGAEHGAGTARTVGIGAVWFATGALIDAGMHSRSSRDKPPASTGCGAPPGDEGGSGGGTHMVSRCTPPSPAPPTPGAVEHFTKTSWTPLGSRALYRDLEDPIGQSSALQRPRGPHCAVERYTKTSWTTGSQTSIKLSILQMPKEMGESTSAIWNASKERETENNGDERHASNTKRPVRKYTTGERNTQS